MTLLGAALGIAVYVSIHAITGNIVSETRRVIAGYDTDITVQTRDAATPGASRISPEDFAGLQDMFGQDVFPLVVGTLREQWNPYALIIGVSDRLGSRFGFLEGRPLAAGKHEVMVGVLTARRLGLRPDGILSVGSREYRICGIYSVGSNIIDGAVVVDLAEAQQLVGKEGFINLAMVRASDRGTAQKVSGEINARFPRLKAQPSSDFVANIRIFKAVETFALAIALISFVGACLVVSNTLAMAVVERTREIGILMAVGWRPYLVLRVLFAESIMLCLCGAVAGNGLALLILRALNRSRAIGFGWVPVVIAPENFLYSLGLSMILACIALLWPTVVVFRLSPAEAIRRE